MHCKARQVYLSYLHDKENGSKMAFVAGATKINLNNLKTELKLDDLMHEIIRRHQLYNDGRFEILVLPD